MAGTIISGNHLTGVVLSNSAAQNPATIAPGAYVTNTGTTNNGDAIYGTDAAAWTLLNDSTIKAAGSSAAGVQLGNGGTVANGRSGSTSGLIEGNAYGVVISGASGTVTNFGTLEGAGTVGASFGFGVRLLAGGSVSNLGTIEGIGSNSFGIDLGEGGSVTNGQNGSIEGLIIGPNKGIAIYAGSGTVTNFGAIEGGFAVLFDGASGSLTNFGKIDGTGANGVGVLLTSAGSVTVTNASTAMIAGYVGVGVSSLDSGASTIINYGTITGTGGNAVAFGGAGSRDLLVVEPAAVFNGMVAGFRSGDTIDFVHKVGTGATVSNGVLTLLNGTAAVAALDLSGTFVAGAFAVAPDGQGGTDVIAADIWTDGSGSWDTAGDWTGGVPVPASDVTIGDTATGAVSLDHAATVNNLTIDAGNALTTTGGTLTVMTTVSDSGTLILGGDLSLVGTVTVGGAASLGLSGGEIIDATLAGPGTIQTDYGQSGALDDVTISSGTTYTASDNASTTLVGTIDNVGAIDLNGGNGQNGYLLIGGAVTLTGGGTVSLSTTATNGGNAFVEGNGSSLINANDTIRGTGVIGNGSLIVINQGTIEATPEGGTSALTLNGGAITNTNLLEATGGGELVIDSGVTNSGGNITATGGGSAVVVNNGATIAGGTLNTSAGGVMETNPGSAATLQSVTISSGTTYAASDNASTTLVGTIANTGAIDLGGGNGQNGYLLVGGAVTLTGGGTVILGTTAANGGNAFVQGNGDSLTNANNTIRGTGVIGNGSLILINQGTIEATPQGGTSALALNGGAITSTNLLEATGDGELVIDSGVTNTGGNITAGSGSAVVVNNGATIAGGTLNTSAGGVMETNPGSAATLQSVTISSGTTYTASDNASTTLVGTIANVGAIDLNGGNGQNGYLLIGGAVTLTGGGTVSLSTTATNGGNAFVEGNGSSLINANDTIRGTGVIGNGSLAVVNHGTIDANSSGGPLITTLTLNGGAITNTNLLEATGGGELVIDSGITNSGGNITATGGGSAVVVNNGATIAGGTLNTSAGGVMETNPGSAATLQSVTISSGTTYTASDNANTTLVGTIDNVGAIDLNGGNGQNGYLLVGGAVTLTGGGTVILGTTAANGGNAFVQGNGDSLTNANNTIRGTGVIGNGSLIVINQGTIEATPEGGTSRLTLNGSGGVSNTGRLEAAGGGVLLIGATVDNAGGNITVADSASAVEISNATIQGGTLNNTVGGTLATAGSDATLDGSTHGALTIGAKSVYTASDNASTTLVGTIANEGAIDLNGGNGQNGYLLVGGAVTLTGGGTVSLSTIATSGGNAFVQGNGDSLTNADNTIRGTGIIGNGSLIVVNHGTIDATPEGGTSALTLDGGAITNTNLLEATGGGTLALTNGTINNQGMVAALDDSAVTYTSGASDANNAGGILTGGTWEAIATGDGATVSITGGAVTTDAAKIVLSGAGSVFQDGNGSTFSALEGSLTTIAATGELAILNDRNYALGVATLTDAGTILLGGGVLSGGALTIAGTGTLTGFGTVGDPTNNGRIDASGGTLDITTAIIGSGSLQIDGGSEIELGAATSEAVIFAATTGKLRIADPASANFAGTIAGFSGSDIIELAGTDATSATPGSFNARNDTTILRVDLASGGPLVYTLAGNDSSDGFAITHVNNGADSDITLAASGTPSIRAPITATVGMDQPGAISGVSIAEAPATSGETFTVTLSDTRGDLSATGTGVSGSGTTNLTITGSLGQVNADLGTLTDSDAQASSDKITINASDSNGRHAAQQQIAVSVTDTLFHGIVLENPATQNPTTLPAGADVTNIGIANFGDAVYGTNAAAWKVTNLGTIDGRSGPASDGIRLIMGGFVTNGQSDPVPGLITASLTGVEIDGAAGTVVNFGIILGTGPQSGGVYLTAGGSVTNAQGGLIEGSVQGVAIGHGSGTVANSGTIEGTGTNGSGIYLTNGGNITNDANGLITGAADGVEIGHAAGTVVNSGTIEATRVDAVYLGAGGSITNALGGAISGVDAGVEVVGATGTMLNDGTIQATGTGGNGVFIGSPTVATGAAVTVVNNAAIIGNIGVYVSPLDTGADTIVNDGTITGTGGIAVALGRGFDRLVMTPAAQFAGQVQGGGPRSTLELAAGSGPGVLGGLGTKFVDFGAVTVDGGANWTIDALGGVLNGVTLTGNNTASTLDVISSGLLYLASVSDFNVIQLAPSGDSVTLTDTVLSGGTVTIIGGSGGGNAIDASEDSAASAGKSLIYVAGNGSDYFTGGYENDTVTVTAAAVGDDSLTGGSGSNTLAIAGAGVANLSGVSGFGSVVLPASGQVMLALTSANFAGLAASTIAVVAGVAGDTIDASAIAASDSLIFTGGGGDDSVTGGPGNNVYQFTSAPNAGLDITNGSAGGTAPHGELTFGSGVTQEDLWFVASGSNLVAETIGTPQAATINGWFGSNASAQLQEIVSGNGLEIDTQIGQLVTAMASYSASHPSFNPTASGATMPDDPTLQNAIAAAWHSTG